MEILEYYFNIYFIEILISKKVTLFITERQVGFIKLISTRIFKASCTIVVAKTKQHLSTRNFIKKEKCVLHLNLFAQKKAHYFI